MFMGNIQKQYFMIEHGFASYGGFLLFLILLVVGTDGARHDRPPVLADLASECDQLKPRTIYAAMISKTEFPSADDHESLRKWFYVRNFTTSVFANVSTEVFPEPVRIWPPIQAMPCNGQAMNPKSPGRGLNLVHLDILHDFFLYYDPCDALIVFEDDVFSAHPHAGQEAIDTVMKQREDLNYLGYCYKRKEGHPRSTSKYPPLCTHAYAVTAQGARRLYNLIDSCYDHVGGIDAQMQNLALTKQISWAVPLHIESDSPGYLMTALSNNGMHLSPPHPFDGLFVQGKFDSSVKHFRDGTVAHIIHHKGINILYNGEWRPLRSMDNFYRLGIRHEDVLTISYAQMKSFPIGTPLTDEDIKTIKASRVAKMRNETKS